MERTEAPTEERLMELRARGIVPYSAFSTRCIACSALLLSLFAVRNELRNVLIFYRMRVVETAEFNLAALREFVPLVSQIVSFLCIPLIAVIVATFTWGFLQTKFLLVISQLGLHPERMGKSILPHLSDLVGTVAGSFLIALVALSIALGASYASSYAVAEMLLLGPESAMHWTESIFVSVSPLLVMVLFSLAVVSWLIARARFLRTHRMTRREMEHGVE